MTRLTQLGAHFDGSGTTFTVISRHADAVELCLFERPDSASARRRVRLQRSRRRGEEAVWWTQFDDSAPGTLYGYRVHGPYEPQNGHVFNPSKLLLDPWARAVTGRPRVPPGRPVYESGLWGVRGEIYDSTDSAAAMPKCIVAGADDFDWQGVSKPGVLWRDTFIYEVHVKGLTRLHPEVSPELRGTYLGLVQEPVLAHLRRLGVTAVELMPVFQSAPEDHLLRAGRPNYWGYSPVSFFAPEAEYAADPLGGQVAEFKTMVRELHRAGIEVILDVVYNHTAEGGRFGPYYSLKGFDQALFYRLGARNPRRHEDFTGCGNTLDVGEAEVRRLVLDSLRFWVQEMGVDGFRFDLAPALGRDAAGAFDPRAELFESMALASSSGGALDGVKWIAEPWDVPPRGRPSGYQLGHFPAGWAEWNDRFRDAVRRFWRGYPVPRGGSGPCADLAMRLGGSEDVFGARAPLASVNFVAAHDGFTLADLGAYDDKQNLANGESNRDGTDHNLSSDWGEEGATEDGQVLAQRALHRRNLLATLLLAQGIPMLAHGDELGRSQSGNNNAYCHDDETTWLDWSRTDRALLDWTRRLAELRARFPQLRRATPLRGLARSSDPDVLWWDASGHPVAPDRWQLPEFTAFAMALPPVAEAEDGLLLLVNGGSHAVTFELPTLVSQGPLRCRLLFDSADPEIAQQDGPEPIGSRAVAARSQVLLAYPLP